MKYFYKELLKKENIDVYSPLPLSEATVLRQDKLNRMGIETG